MSLLLLEGEGLRCLQAFKVALHPRVNLLTGPNGSGKTTFLEALYLLGRGRSFRTRHTERLITHGKDRLTIFGRSDVQGFEAVGVGYDRHQGLQVRISGRDAKSVAELSEAFPVQVLDPGIHRLVEEGPAFRRRWLDWGVFHVEHGFVGQWSDYSRILRQRNAALKQGLDPSPWDPDLARLGEALALARMRTVQALQPWWSATLAALLGEPVTLGYFRGWSQDESLLDSLATHRARDRERGSTGSGAHRFDIQLKLEGRPAREVLSRGQQKLLGATMAISMARLAGSASGRPPALLLDDPAAELDRPHTDALVNEIRTFQCQLIVTALHSDDARFGDPDQAFHVEHGRITTL